MFNCSFIIFIVFDGVANLLDKLSDILLTYSDKAAILTDLRYYVTRVRTYTLPFFP